MGRKDAGRTGWAAERVIDIAHGGEGDARQQLFRFFRVDVRHLAQGTAHGHKIAAIGPEELDPQRRRTAAAAIVGAASAQPQQDVLVARLHGVADELTHAVSGGLTGVFAIFYLRQTGGRGHLNHGLPAGQL